MRFLRFLVRLTSFLGKEILEILHQPRLILLLVLGPFLILFLFGIGYRSDPFAFRTLFVAPEGSQLDTQVREYATSISPQLIYLGVTTDREAALQSLRNRETDLVAIVPPNADETIRNDQQAVFTILHDEIDPTRVDYIQYFGGTIIDGVNRRVLLNFVSEGQQESAELQDNLQSARESASAMRQALEARNAAAARQSQQQMNRDLDAVSLAVGATMGVLSGVEQTTGSGRDSSTAEVLAALAAIRQESAELGDVGERENSSITETDVARVARIEQQIAALESRLSAFRSIRPEVLVSPFAANTTGIAPVQPTMVGFFVPAVLALLLQHLAVTLAALSIVREQQSGAMELFRVSPISAAETLVGKYLSYMIFQGILATILTALILYGLRMPMLGRWQDYALTIAAVTFASLGMGFVISLISATDSQAVQFTMIVLLTSVFFSGFFMSLDMLWQPLHAISWALPTTYGIIILRNIMLRGPLGSSLLLPVLWAIGAVLAVLAWFLLRRRMARG